MPATVQHVLSATTPDNTSYEIRPSHWNSAHAVSLNISATEISGLFSNANGISFGLSNNSITASHNALTTAANSTHTHGSVAFTGTNVSATFTSASNGLSVNLSVPDVGGAQTGISGLSAGTTQMTSGTAVFSNSNGISFGVNGNTVTASHNALTTAAQSNHSHGNPTLALTNLSGTTASNSAGLTLSLSAAAPGGGGTISAYAQSNTTQSSSGTFPASSVQFQGNGGVSVGVSNGSVVLSAPGTSSLSATGAASISVNGATVSIGVGTVTASATSNTTQGSSGTLNLNGLVFHGAGGASVGISNGSVVISGATGGAGGGVAVSAGANSVSNGTVVFSNSNGLTFGLNGSTVTASHNGLTTAALSNHSHGNPTLALTNVSGTTASNSAGLTLSLSVAAPGAAAENNWFNLTGNTSGNTTASGSTIALSGGNNITLSGTNGSVIRIDAPASSSLVGTQGVSLSTNGSTVSISQIPLSGFDPFLPAGEVIIGQMGQNTLHFVPVDVMAPIAINNLQFPVHFTGATNSTGSYTISQALGFYTQVNSTQLSRLTAFTVTTGISHNGTQNSSINVGGYRTWAGTVGSYVLPPGCYVVGHWSSSASAGANATISNWILSNVNTAMSGALGSANNASNQFRAFQGSYSTTSGAFPDSVGRSQIQGSAAVNLRPPLWCVYSA